MQRRYFLGVILRIIVSSGDLHIRMVARADIPLSKVHSCTAPLFVFDDPFLFLICDSVRLIGDKLFVLVRVSITSIVTVTRDKRIVEVSSSDNARKQRLYHPVRSDEDIHKGVDSCIDLPASIGYFLHDSVYTPGFSSSESAKLL